ncbi:histidine-rich glycoprotein-like [Harpegnathos saltator]|uniref:histidine-rich glycoprotein-like n=1 Tax=Harpegnathos saltator TaxID=610380 RepID=UPI000DBEECA2|nr:histidine-rich glycoprotein-like [Harpegnathos saltator]
MHGISHLLSHHGSDNADTRSSISSASSDTRNHDTRSHDTRILQELLSQKHDGKLYLHERHVSRGSVSSAYSYGSSSYGSSHGSNSSNHGAYHSVYHTIHGNGHHHHHAPLHHHHHQQLQHHQALSNSSGKASPTSSSPTNEHEKQHQHHHHHHHHHHSIQEMIRHFGRRLGHIRRQSECQESPKKREEDFRNRSQSLDGSARPPADLQEADCETTYRIYESILRQGNDEGRAWVSRRTPARAPVARSVATYVSHGCVRRGYIKRCG